MPAPGAFYSRRLLAGAGGIDIRYKHMDDWPLWLRMLPHVDRLSWIDKPLVLYRIGQTSVSQRSRANPINPILHNDREKLYRDFQKKQLDRCNRWHQRLQMIRNKLTLTCLRNTWLGYRLMMTLQLLSPILYKDLYIKGKNKLRSILKNIIPISRGFWYFGMRGLLNRVRVFGPISIRIPVNRIVLGQHVSIYEGVTLNGKLDSEDIIEIGEHSIIEKNAYINSHGGKITLGKRVHIGVGCILQGMGNLCIANETMLGPHVQIYTSNHRSSSPQLPRRLLGERLCPVSVGFNCWIGAGSILLPGSHLAAGSVLAAGTVVRREKVEIIE